MRIERLEIRHCNWTKNKLYFEYNKKYEICRCNEKLVLVKYGMKNLT